MTETELKEITEIYELDEKERRRYKHEFRNFRITFYLNTEGWKIIEFTNSEAKFNRLKFVFEKPYGNLIITGDYQTACYSFGSTATLNQIQATSSIKRFSENCRSSSEGKFFKMWDIDEAKKEFIEYLENSEIPGTYKNDEETYIDLLKLKFHRIKKYEDFNQEDFDNIFDSGYHHFIWWMYEYGPVISPHDHYFWNELGDKINSQICFHIYGLKYAMQKLPMYQEQIEIKTFEDSWTKLREQLQKQIEKGENEKEKSDSNAFFEAYYYHTNVLNKMKKLEPGTVKK